MQQAKPHLLRAVPRPDLVAPRVRTRLMEVLNHHYKVREIRCEFRDAGLPEGVAEPLIRFSTDRRSVTQGLYEAIDFANPDHASRFIDAVSAILRRVCSAHIEGWTEPPPYVSELVEELKRSGWQWTGEEVVRAASAASIVNVQALAARMDLTHLAEQLARVERAVESDPAAAIGGAKEILETVSKTILGQRGVAFSPREEVPALCRKAFAALRQLPDDVPDAAKGVEVIRVMLQHLAAVPQSMAELRNLYGTGHGRDGKARGLRARHARLAVGAAATLATYLLETHVENLAADQPKAA